MFFLTQWLTTRATFFLKVVVVLGIATGTSAEKNGELSLPKVLNSVKTQYPPYLAALIQQDIANGRARQAMGAFDLSLTADAFLNPAGFYNGAGGETLLTQPLPFMGGSVFGGYRLSSGFLPDYNKERTGDDGQAVLGFSLPLLKDLRIDKRRAALWKAEIDQELADPIILRQYLDFVRAATISYFNWLAAGHQLALAEEVLQVAKDRDEALAAQIERGASAEIVRIDNRRLVVTREISVVQALRRFQATAIELSLFYRNDETKSPIIAARTEVPSRFPAMPLPLESTLESDIRRAIAMRPEIRRIELLLKKNGIDQRLAKNGMLPELKVGLEAYQGLSGTTPSDIEETEVDARVLFSLPLQRRKAKGRLEETGAIEGQLIQERHFAEQEIAADVRDSFSALVAAYRGIAKSAENVDLARQLEQAELDRLEEGVTDLLALQIREKASFDARILEVEARAAYFRALTNYEAAIASSAPSSLLP